MDKIARLRQEIERRIKLYSVTNEKELWIANTYWSVLSFLDTLSEEPDKSLEEAAKEYAKDAYPDKYNLIWMFKRGAEWQAEKCDEETSKLLYAERQTAYINGWDDHKEQMLKDAIEGEVIKTDKHTSVRYKSFYGTDRYFYGIADKQFKPGDKVRIVVLPAMTPNP